MVSTCSLHVWEVHKFHFFLEKKRGSIYRAFVVLALVGYPVNTLLESKAVQLKTASSLEIYVWHTCIIFSSQTVKFGSQATSCRRVKQTL